MILDQIRLDAAHMIAELHRSHDIDFLRVHNRHEPARDLLLPLRPEPLCGALARFTPLGRLHALYWTLAYGQLEDHLRYTGRVGLEFSSGTRFGRESRTQPLPLGDRYWIADVEGLHMHVELLLDGTGHQTLPIPSATRC